MPGQQAPVGNQNARLLTGGVIAGPLYLIIGLAQALTRAGFDFAKHPLSVLANGDAGWVQTANFVVTGLLVIGAGVALGRVLRARAPKWFLAAYGVSMLAAAIFPADPVDGFPPGTAVGAPTSITTTGLLHFMAGGIGFTCLAISCFVTARALARGGQTTLSRLSIAAGLVVVIGFFGMFIPGLSLGIAGIWLAVVVGWLWLSLVCHSLRTHEAMHATAA